VNGPALYTLAIRPQSDEPRSDFTSGSVRERESADARGREATLFDQKPNALDQTKSLPCTGTGEYQEWPRVSLDGRALRD
jgi:hypothetical protein